MLKSQKNHLNLFYIALYVVKLCFFLLSKAACDTLFVIMYRRMNVPELPFGFLFLSTINMQNEIIAAP